MYPSTDRSCGIRTRTTSLRSVVVAVIVLAALGVQVRAQGAAVDLQVREHPEIGAHVVDARGRTVYRFAADSPFTSTCIDACADRWEPVRFAGVAPTSAGLNPVLVGVVFRPDGTSQASFGGMPLYTFVGDDAEGSILGLHESDEWSAVAPDGSAISSVPSGEDGGGEAEALSPEELIAMGRDLYATFCAACHELDGRGSAGPSLISNARIADDTFVARQIRDGMSEMPGFGPILSDDQLAAVASYVRTSFGNDYPVMGPGAFAR